jgi:hypothetical protein
MVVIIGCKILDNEFGVMGESNSSANLSINSIVCSRPSVQSSPKEVGMPTRDLGMLLVGSLCDPSTMS